MTDTPSSAKDSVPPGSRSDVTQKDLQQLQEQIEVLQLRIRNLESHSLELSFKSRIKFQERLGREEFFYKAFRALSFNQIDGDYVEFGSHGGTTFSLAYHQTVLHRHKAKLWAFDSFQGFPDQRDTEDEHPKWIKGKMSTSLEDFHRICAEAGVPKDSYTVVPGFYSDVLPTLAKEDSPNNIALAYIDCDLYSSTQDVLTFLWPRLKHGMILAFDDYYCWSDTQASGERIAMLEAFGESDEWELVPYLQFGWHGLAFVLQDKALNPTGLKPNF